MSIDNQDKRPARRRRVIIQTATGAVVGAAALTAAFQLPGLFKAGETAPVEGVAVVQAGGPAAPASSAPAVVGDPDPAGSEDRPNAGPGISPAEEKALDKYFASGYDLSEGQKLQKLWKMQDKELIQVKAIAGQKLLDGKKLPVKPGYVAPPDQPIKDKQVDAFFKEGYDYDDAAQLAKLWKLPTPYDAKVAGGKKILAGETLPIKP